MAGFEQLGEQVVYSGAVFKVSTGKVSAPDGQVLTREYVRHPGAVVVVPVVGGDVVLVRQYRAVIDNYLLELPAGKRDISGEEPKYAAARELREEVGLEARSLKLLSSFYNTPGFSDEYSYLYLGTDCVEVKTDRKGIEEEHMSIERVPLSAVLGLITDGTINDAKSIIGLLLARQVLGVT